MIVGPAENMREGSPTHFSHYFLDFGHFKCRKLKSANGRKQRCLSKGPWKISKDVWISGRLTIGCWCQKQLPGSEEKRNSRNRMDETKQRWDQGKAKKGNKQGSTKTLSKDKRKVWKIWREPQEGKGGSETEGPDFCKVTIKKRKWSCLYDWKILAEQKY